MFAIFLSDRYGVGILRLRPQCLGSLRDPIANQLQLGFGQLRLALGHFPVTDFLKQDALIGHACHDRGATLSALVQQTLQT